MRIIINVEDNSVTAPEAVEAVSNVIGGGLVSANGKCYCYLTVFNDGIVVSAKTLKTGNHSFNVWRKIKI